ncbi:MAG: FHA domain-containing protein [Deltaproteobacteria bacterium]|nr:FHA domain-containing protein [Deltaproteobacteria bacterium]
MKVLQHMGPWFLLVGFILLLAPREASAQRRDVHWQVNPQGFPADVSVFVDVEENGVFKRNLPASAFAVSMDEYAGDQGGWILNQQQVASGWAGAQVLVILDISRSYSKEFDKAKRMMRAIVNYLDPKRDTVALATSPAKGGFKDAKLEAPFTNNKATLLKTIDRIKRLPSDDKSGSRICNSLSEGIRWFPAKPSDRYRVVIFLTGGADKGEGKGDCVKDSFSAGLVPFFPMVFKLDRKYDDPRNSHKIENKTHELAQKTGGRSIFRQSEKSYLQFVGLLWNRIRSQYYLKVTFPCYRPMPTISHVSMLKVEGNDAEGIKFDATSAPAPTPVVRALYPPQATRKDVDDGNINLTIDGSGFCGHPGQVKVYVGGRQVATKSQNPFRVVASLNSSVDSGKVKVINRFGQNGESLTKFEIVKPPKGAEASTTLTALIVGIVVLAAFAILFVTVRGRKAKVPKGGAPIMPSSPGSAPSQVPSTGGAAKTMALNAIARAWIQRKDGTEVDLSDGINLIGREDTCAVKLEVPGVSREHARIDLQQDQGLIWVEDLGSTNGTFWGSPGASENDLKKLEKKHLLNEGDTIWISGECLTVRFTGGTQAPREV